jgi:hypothetical protein
VHQGTIGDWYDHTLLQCSTGGATFTTITPAAGGVYFLIVPLDDDAEGGYGADAFGVQRPSSSMTCRPASDTSCD